MALAASFASADVLDVSIGMGDISSMDEYGSGNNLVFNIDMGAVFGGAYQNFTMTALGWDVTLEAHDPSYLSEMALGFENSDVTDSVYLTPGVADNFPGGPTFYSSGGLVDLVGLGYDVTLNADNILTLNFFEWYDDFPGGEDGLWLSGSQVNCEFTADAVPEPMSMTVLALGLGAMAARRRRKS